MKVTGYAQDRGACTVLRIKAPLDRIGKLKLADVEIVGAGDDQQERKVKQADTVVIGRCASEQVLQLVRHVKSLGKRVVYDLDDNMFSVSPFSPHYAHFGMMPVNLQHPELGSAPMWVDGQGEFHVTRNRKLRELFIRVIRSVDCVTVTTPPLQEAYLRYNDNVSIVPNSIDFGVWKRMPFRREDENVRILYTGASNHREDWHFLRSVLEQLQKDHPRWTLVLVGMDWATVDSDLDRSRVEFHDWVDIEAYPYLIRSLNCDIGLAPISSVPFNDGRSSIKWLEYSALKMASVLSNYGPYKRDCVDGETALLCDTKEEWHEALSRLITDAEWRRIIGENAYKAAKKDYDLDYMVDAWLMAYSGKVN